VKISDHVSPNPKGYELAGFARFGFVNATVHDFAVMFGGEHEFDPSDPRVTHQWFFETPRGRASIRRDYGYPDGVLTMAASDPHAVQWLARYLRHHKLTAYTGDRRQ